MHIVVFPYFSNYLETEKQWFVADREMRMQKDACRTEFAADHNYVAQALPGGSQGGEER